MAEIDFKSPDFKKLTVALAGLHRSAYPSAIRGTLNRAAFDVKGRTLKISTTKAFNDRSNFRFFKALSGVNKAKGFDVGSMVSETGMVKTSRPSDDVNNFGAYEGTAPSKQRSFIPIDKTRVGGNRDKKRSGRNQFNKIPKFIRSSMSSGKSQKQKLIKSAIIAKKGGYVLHKKTLFRVTTLQSSIKQRRLKVKFKPIYSYDSGRVDRLKKNKFMTKAGELTVFRINDFFLKEAEFQINKELKRKGL